MTKNSAFWWKSFCKFQDLSKLAEFALRLFNVPASTAAIERNFAAESRIHTKVRNQLNHPQVEKLLAIQAMDKVFNKLNIQENFAAQESCDEEDDSNDSLNIDHTIDLE